MKRIFLPIEIKVRELDSKILFALCAAERGYETILGGQLELIERVPRLGKGIYIDKSTAVTKREWFLKCRQLGNYVTAWDEEGLIFLNDEVYHATRMDPVAFSHVDLFFAWGDAHRQTVLHRYPDAAERVIPVGNSRMDLLRPEFRGYSDRRVELLRRIHGPFILINTNFALHNFAKGKEAAAKIFDPYPLAGQKSLLRDWYEFQHQGFNAFCAAIPELHDRFPSHKIIIRPSPAEDAVPWQELAARLERVVCSKEGNVVEWMRAADATVQFNCTTGVEAFLLGKPSISYRPVTSPVFETTLSLACSFHARTLDALQQRLASVIAAADNVDVPLPVDSDVMKKHLASWDGPAACEQILDVLAKYEMPARPVTLSPVPLIKRIWRAWLRVVRRPNPLDIQYYRGKFPGLSVEEAREVAADLSRTTGRFKNVQISGAGHNIIRVYPI